MNERPPLSHSGLLFGALFVACTTVCIGLFADTKTMYETAALWNSSLATATQATTAPQPCLDKNASQQGVEVQCRPGCTYDIVMPSVSATVQIKSSGYSKPGGPPGTVNYYGTISLFGLGNHTYTCAAGSTPPSLGATLIANNNRDLVTNTWAYQATESAPAISAAPTAQSGLNTNYARGAVQSAPLSSIAGSSPSTGNSGLFPSVEPPPGSQTQGVTPPTVTPAGSSYLCPPYGNAYCPPTSSYADQLSAPATQDNELPTPGIVQQSSFGVNTAVPMPTQTLTFGNAISPADEGQVVNDASVNNPDMLSGGEPDAPAVAQPPTAFTQSGNPEGAPLSAPTVQQTATPYTPPPSIYNSPPEVPTVEQSPTPSAQSDIPEGTAQTAPAASTQGFETITDTNGLATSLPQTSQVPDPTTYCPAWHAPYLTYFCPGAFNGAGS